MNRGGAPGFGFASAPATRDDDPRGSGPGTRRPSSARTSARFQTLAEGIPTGYGRLKLGDRLRGPDRRTVDGPRGSIRDSDASPSTLSRIADATSMRNGLPQTPPRRLNTSSRSSPPAIDKRM